MNLIVKCYREFVGKISLVLLKIILQCILLHLSVLKVENEFIIINYCCSVFMRFTQLQSVLTAL